MFVIHHHLVVMRIHPLLQLFLNAFRLFVEVKVFLVEENHDRQLMVFLFLSVELLC